MSISEKDPKAVDCAIYALTDLMLYKDSFWKEWNEPKYCIIFAKKMLADVCKEFYHTVGIHWMTPCTEKEYLEEQNEFSDFWLARIKFEEGMR